MLSDLYWFSSQLHDEDPDIYHYLYRPYAPNLQRWLNNDPLGESGGVNLVTFVANNPIGNFDPDGQLDASQAADYYNQASINGLTQGGFTGYAKFIGAQFAEDFVDLTGATGIQGSWEQAGSVSGDPNNGQDSWKYIGLATAMSAANVVPVEGQAASLVERKAAGKLLKVCDKAVNKASKIDRAAFKAEREAFWKSEAKNNPTKYTSNDIDRMNGGKPPIGSDGYPVELHHVDRTPDGGVTPMTRTDHRLGDNYKINHP